MNLPIIIWLAISETLPIGHGIVAYSMLGGRGTNMQTGWQRKVSVRNQECKLFQKPPGELRELLGAYILGVATPRSVLV